MSLAASLGSDCKETSSDDARSSFLYAVQMGFFSGLVYYENLWSHDTCVFTTCVPQVVLETYERNIFPWELAYPSPRHVSVDDFPFLQDMLSCLEGIQNCCVTYNALPLTSETNSSPPISPNQAASGAKKLTPRRIRLTREEQLEPKNHRHLKWVHHLNQTSIFGFHVHYPLPLEFL